MDKFFRLFPWVLLALTATCLVIISTNQQIAPETIEKIIKNPLIIAMIVSAFVFLTVDRLKDMNARISMTENRTTTFWQDAIKEIQNVSSTQAKLTVKEMQESLLETINSHSTKVDELLKNNPWLTDVMPDELALNTKNLEPIHHRAAEILKNDTDGKKTELIRNWISSVIEDPEVTGKPNDYHNIGVMASNDLRDDLLALKIYKKYLEKAGENPNFDVISDALQIATQASLAEDCENISKFIRKKIAEEDFNYTNAWRPWVFLSDYYASLGNYKKSIRLLEEAILKIKSPQNRPHAMRNLAELYADSGEIEMADKYSKELVQSYPAYIPGGLTYVRFLWGIGRRDEATQICESFLRNGNLNPQFEIHYERLLEYKNKMERDNAEASSQDHFQTGISFVLSVADDLFEEEMVKSLIAEIKNKLQENNIS